MLLLSTILSVVSSCIEPYSLDIKNQAKDEYVVSGQVTDQEGYQMVSVSSTSTISKPTYNPISNCLVKIIDNQGNEFRLAEFEKGNYRVWMDKKFLVPGNSYQVDVMTESGIQIVSAFDQMPECPELDSIYFIREDIPTTNPNNPLQGIQFYVDVDGKNTNSHYFRWEIVETWEHHSAYPKSWYWNGITITKYTPPDYSRFYCWSTVTLKNIYNLTTEGLAQNKFKMQKLHFVDNNSQRLTYCYSILVRQFAQSEPAYQFWEKMRINSNEHGGLYDTQPLRVKGNLKCTSNPELEVLGFFSASAMKSKRIFVMDVDNLDKYYPPCEPRAFDKGEPRKNQPLYLVQVPGGGLMVVEKFCVECDVFPGTTVKPSFWPY